MFRLRYYGLNFEPRTVDKSVCQNVLEYLWYTKKLMNCSRYGSSGGDKLAQVKDNICFVFDALPNHISSAISSTYMTRSRDGGIGFNLQV